MCKSKKQIEQTTQPVEEYPRYVSINPQGEDLFEGKSQQKLAEAIAFHITESDKQEKNVFPRLIGVEGKWGSGKSNVIKLIEGRLQETNTYTFFNFDAWGNQEDLQRRSILELLTRYLIDNGKLTGKTKKRGLSSASDSKLIEEICTWDEKLESLLSRKSYTKNITIPSLNNSTKWFVLVLLLIGLVVAFLSVNNTGKWWANLLIATAPFLIFTAIMIFTNSSWRKMFAMYNTEGRSDTTSYVISEQEPSVREFKDWMKELSNGIPENEKLVLVFDNMDRLPSEKVHQFWSLIQTFFADADDGYKNIWCIVPYDENHLAWMFSDKDTDDERINLLRGFLSKTFPIIYRVPEPIVADYKIIFEHLFRNAFGSTVNNEDIEAISRCYRHYHFEPNVREMISFINSNVLLAKQWKATIRPLSIALYVLKADSILRNPTMAISDNGDKTEKDVTTEEYLLAQGYYKDFKNLLSGNPSVSYLQSEVPALVYGIEPTKAQQIVVKRHIRNCMADTDGKLSFGQYIDTPQFMLLLDDDIHNMDVVEYKRATMLLDGIDETKLSPSGRIRLEGIWHYLGQQYNYLKKPETEFSEYHSTLFKHLRQDDAKVCAATFCRCLVENKEVDGNILFEQLSALFESDFATNFVPIEICPSTKIEPKRFAYYVEHAGDEYRRYPIYTDVEELNRFIENSVGVEFPYLNTLLVLKNDNKYSVAQVGEFAVHQINNKVEDVNMAVNCIGIQRVFYDKFQSTVDNEYVNLLWQSVQGQESSSVYKEIYALKARDGFEQMPDDADSIDSLLTKILFYISTTDLIKLYLQNTSINFRRNLLVKMISEKIHDNFPDYPEFVEKWQALVDALGIEWDTIVYFADSWGYISLSNQAKTKSYFSLLSDVAWFDVLLRTDTALSRELLEKCVEELSKQDASQFIHPGTANHTQTNWDVALQKLIDTPYISTNNLGKLTNMAAQLLDFIARNSVINDVTWNKLLEMVDYASISASIVDIRNKIFRGEDGYRMTPDKFQQLHGWLEQCEINNIIHCSDAANQILSKVIDNAECQNIILSKKEYYKPIITSTLGSASELHNKLKIIVKNQSDTEFAAYIRNIVDYTID